LETVREPNPYRDIEYFPDSGKFQVSIPNSRRLGLTCLTFYSLAEAIEARDGIAARRIDSQSPFSKRLTRTLPPLNQAIHLRDSQGQELETA
jgi:hypothetical protein